jgi:2-oxoglutarate dehydrogenase E1 component
MTPKSLLRLPACTSSLEELAQGRFLEVIPDPSYTGKGIKRVLLCSGKVYYDLVKQREELGRKDVAIVRLEQFYPFPEEQFKAALEPYADGTDLVWVQDEPQNMGGWPFLRLRFCTRALERFPFRGVTRPPSASPATGSARSHRLEQEELLSRAFADH